MTASSLLDKCIDIRLGRHNLFDAIRLYAATQVLIQHGAHHLEFIPASIVSAFFSLPGVPLFFSISGFLVGLSCLRFKGRWGEYIWHRALRIFPALWLCLFISCLILIAFGKGSFLLSLTGMVWLAGQATVVQFFNPSQLRDFGVGVVNGSLWTIPVEIQFYIVLPILVTVATYWVKRCRARLVAACMISLATASLLFKLIILDSVLNPESLLAKLFEVSFVPHLFQFMIGFSCLLPLAIFGRRKATIGLIAFGLICLSVSTSFPDFAPLFKPWALAALPIGIGLIPVDLLRGFDVSYGLYLFHMPIANALLASSVAPSLAIPIFFSASYLIAAFSWCFLEKPALSLKSKIPSFLAGSVSGS
ncbi:acyltransferase [Cyanobium sp. L1E-Cus]|uniref:acyltransferase family protein n=1 Tax=Cyanobium sp. L1E-Cus TaxID=2823714 RepID=UPI0020CD2DE8|nr:acyltransferase [Cyanobium sp. L1E-Cus]MCP9823738.1 acyltransferase [Cyanobium sp. L1E-Cus]